jgi:hypothetical protein
MSLYIFCRKSFCVACYLFDGQCVFGYIFLKFNQVSANVYEVILKILDNFDVFYDENIQNIFLSA